MRSSAATCRKIGLSDSTASAGMSQLAILSNHIVTDLNPVRMTYSFSEDGSNSPDAAGGIPPEIGPGARSIQGPYR